jgi:hypothetical protein
MLRVTDSKNDRENKTIESGRGWNIEEWHDLAPTTYSVVLSPTIDCVL